MKAQLKNIKDDLYNVFIMGNASNSQIARVYYLLAIPGLTLFFAVANLLR